MYTIGGVQQTQDLPTAICDLNLAFLLYERAQLKTCKTIMLKLLED